MREDRSEARSPRPSAVEPVAQTAEHRPTESSSADRGAEILALQRSIGNAQLVEMLRSGGSQGISADVGIGPAPIQRRTTTDGANPADPKLSGDALYEAMAVSWAYMDHDGDDPEYGKTPWQTVLRQSGYSVAGMRHGSSGLAYNIYYPADGGHLPPVICFRGTEFSKVLTDRDAQAGLKDDFNPTGIGRHQFDDNRAMIQSDLEAAKAKHGSVVATGHSLAGTLAELTAIYFPGDIDRVVTFAGAGVDRAALDSYHKQGGRRVDSEQVRVDGDVIPLAGAGHIDGTIHTFADTSVLDQLLSGIARLPLKPPPSAGAKAAALALLEYTHHVGRPVESIARDGEHSKLGALAESRVTDSYEATGTQSSAQDNARADRTVVEGLRQVVSELVAIAEKVVPVITPLLNKMESSVEELPSEVLQMIERTESILEDLAGKGLGELTIGL